MDIAKAFEVCHNEYNDMVKSFTPESEKIEAQKIRDEYDIIIQTKAYKRLFQGNLETIPSRGIAASMECAIIMALRFGMRVQKKLQSDFDFHHPRM